MSYQIAHTATFLKVTIDLQRDDHQRNIINRMISKKCYYCSAASVSRMIVAIYILSRAQPIRFFWADADVFQFLLPILIFFYYSSSIYFASWGKITTPETILPSAKHFQTTAERHYSAYFLQATWTKKIVSQVTIILWGKIYTCGAILPPADHDWLNWSHDKFGQLDCLSWLWHL